MDTIERPATFYLGKEYDPDMDQVLDDAPIMYDARDLTTHAVCVGMTGSGKTGLGVDLLEEAALDGIPSIIIDPKGDMTNLLLTFPDLAPGDLEPWVNVDDARRKGQTVSEYAVNIAETWSKGLAAWGQSGDRIRRLRESASSSSTRRGATLASQSACSRPSQRPRHHGIRKRRAFESSSRGQCPLC